MNKTISFIALLLLGISTTQGQKFEWAKTIGSSNHEQGFAITVDASGYIYSTGVFIETVDFDPGSGTTNLTAKGKNDVFIQKLDKSGKLVWAKSIGGHSWDDARSIVVDKDGYIYVFGDFEGSADFDPGTGSHYIATTGTKDAFLLKLDASGNLIWVKTFGGYRGDNCRGISMTMDTSGNIYTSGEFDDYIDLDPGSGRVDARSVGETDVYVQKLDRSGNFKWGKTFGGTLNDHCYAMEIDGQGNVFAAGFFNGQVDFDPGEANFNLSSNGEEDIFIQKLDASGSFLWAKTLGGSMDDRCYAVDVDHFGNVFATGFFRKEVDFDPGVDEFNLMAQETDAFTLKLDKSGNFKWAKSLVKGMGNWGTAITLDRFGNVYAAGFFQDTIDFDTGAGTKNLVSLGENDVFIQKLSNTGDFIWAESYGGTWREHPNMIVVDSGNNIYTLGEFTNEVDFDPGKGKWSVRSQDKTDMFIQKLSQCNPSSGTDIITACGSHTWIDGNTYTKSNNSATYLLTNKGGCDSLVTLNLTINPALDITTSLKHTTITANNKSAKYQWLDCDKDYKKINGETKQAFTPTTNGKYAVELTENECVDTSTCVTVTKVNINEILFYSNLAVFPNPTKGEIVIDLGFYSNDIVAIIRNAYGQEITIQNFRNTERIMLNIDGEVGLYFIEIITPVGELITKVIKE